jgi:phosphohistidine swiveling domain-containing protein
MATKAWITDTEPNARYPLYTRLNANDVLPDPVTPLGADLAWNTNIIPGWASGYVELGSFTAEEMLTEPGTAAGMFYGHLYVNQSAVRVVGIRIGIGWEAIDAAFFAGDVPAPPHDSVPADVNEEITAIIGRRGLWALTTETFPELEEDRWIADRVRSERPDLSILSAPALVARARSLMPMERLMWRGETIASNQSAVGPGVIAQVLGGADPTLVVRIIGAAGDVDSAAPSYALWDLSRIVRADPALNAEFGAGSDGLAERVSKHGVFAESFARFLLDFGYRGPSEWDLGSPSWETKPELVLGLIERLRLLDEDSSPVTRATKQDAETATAYQQALSILGDNPEAIATLDGAIASSRRFGAWRERGKTNCIKVLHEARMPLIELGRRLVEQGHLAHEQQVFMALDSELDTLALNPASLTLRFAEREVEWRKLFDLKLPTFIDAREPMTPLAELPRKSANVLATVTIGEVIQGGPASAGIARGRARIVTDPSLAGDLEPGEILIAPQTDPSWTPLFLVSAGVVVDVGAMNSHAMIVSRELGIPCAAGVPNASRRIPNGSLVEVDGSTGTVTVLELPA